VSLAEAAAASAAVPYVIGALRLPLPEHGWYRTNPADRSPQAPIPRPERQVRLWDGGAYENLGLEAMFKPKPPLIGCDMLIVSDASGPLFQLGKNSPKRSPWALFKGELASPRLFDIASDQIRGLRSRMFVAELERKSIKGADLRMGNSVRDVDLKDQTTRDSYDAFQDSGEVAQALRVPTGLTAVPATLFDRIARHGYELADAILTRRLPSRFGKSFHWESAA
jgi:NTE family protein